MQAEHETADLVSAPAKVPDLPNELLERILKLTIKEATLPPAFKNGSDAWTLSHISRQFRAIVLGSARFWTNITATIGDVNIMDPGAVHAIIERANTHKIQLSIIWSLVGVLSEHSDNVDFPNLDSPNPASVLVEKALSNLCIPFSTRIASLSMIFLDADEFQFVVPRFHILPEDFFAGLSEFHMTFVAPSSRIAGRGNPDLSWVYPIFDERLFGSYPGVISPKLSVHGWADVIDLPRDYLAQESRNYAFTRVRRVLSAITTDHRQPLPITLLSPHMSRTAHISLTGTALERPPLEIYEVLSSLPQLCTFTGWLARGRILSTIHTVNLLQPQLPVQLPFMQHLNLSISDAYSKADCLGEFLDLIITPKLTRLSISRFERFVSNQVVWPPRPAPGFLDSSNRVLNFLVRCQNLARLDVEGFAVAQEFDTLQQLIPELQIFRS